MKRSKYEPENKYIKCYCDRRQMILLGWGASLYMNIIGLIIAVFFFVFTLVIASTNSFDIASPIYVLMGFLPLYVYLLRSSYVDCFNDMIRANHALVCSKKVALKAAWHQHLYSQYRIDVDPAEVDPQGDYGTPAIGWLMMAFIVNIIFFFSYGTNSSTSFIYPILFVSVIVGSLRLNAKIKNMTRIIRVVCVLNIVTSGLMLGLYLLGLVAKFA